MWLAPDTKNNRAGITVALVKISEQTAVRKARATESRARLLEYAQSGNKCAFVEIADAKQSALPPEFPRMASTKNKRGKKKPKAILPAIDNFVTSGTQEKYAILSAITEEAEEIFLATPLNDLQCSNEDMVSMFKSLHPVFSLARFCAIYKKNTLAALLISKLQESFQALSGNWGDNRPDDEHVEQHMKKAREGLKNVEETIDKTITANMAARVVIAKFIYARIEPPPSKDKLSLSMSMVVGTDMNILSKWVDDCRKDDQSQLGIFGMKFLFLLSRVNVLKNNIIAIGGAEGFITRFDAQCEKLEALRLDASKKAKIRDTSHNRTMKRRSQVKVEELALSAAQTEAMRGLKEGKLALKKCKKAFALAKTMLKESEEEEAKNNEISAVADSAVEDAENTFIMIITTLGMLILGEPDLQNKLVEYDIFDEFLQIVMKEEGLLQRCALHSLGACADNNMMAQDRLRKQKGLEIILSELNNPQRSGSHRVLASNVLYQCIDNNSENGDYVCDLGILPGLCKMLHHLHQTIHDLERLEQNVDEGESEEQGALVSKAEEADNEEVKKKESNDDDPLKSVECGVRILMTCAKANEQRRNEILAENVVTPLLALTTSILKEIVLVSTQCLVNLLDGSPSTQQELLDGDGIATLSTLLQRFDEAKELTIVRCAATALYVAINNYPPAQEMARHTGCLVAVSDKLKRSGLDVIRMDMAKILAVATDECDANKDEMARLNVLPGITMCAAHSFGTAPTRAAAAWAYGCFVQGHSVLKEQGCRIGGPNVLVELIAEGTFPERTAASLALSKAMEDDIMCKEMMLQARGMHELIKQLAYEEPDERMAAALATLTLCRNNAVSVDRFRLNNGIEPLVDMLKKDDHMLGERKRAVDAITVVTMANLKNKERISQYGGVPALSQILLHGKTENTVQFALIYITRWAFVKGGQEEFRAEGREYIGRIVELLYSPNTLTQRAACHCAYQIAKGNLTTQLLLMKIGIIPILVSMVRPPLSIDDGTASWCVQALGEIAQDDNSREILRRDGAAAALMELGTQAKTEHLRRDAAASYAACTTPGWVFHDGSAEFDSQLSISGITSKPWHHDLHDKKSHQKLMERANDPDPANHPSGEGFEFVVKIALPPSKLQAPNSDPNVKDFGIPKRYYSKHVGKYRVTSSGWKSSFVDKCEREAVQVFIDSPQNVDNNKKSRLVKPGSPYIV